MAAPKLERRTLALSALALPILGMIGLFAWAGSSSSPSASAVVARFFDAYNRRDCAGVSQAFYRAPGVHTPTCAQLFGSSPPTYSHCSESPLSPATASALSSRVPSNYTSVRLVQASCTQSSRLAGKASSHGVVFDFLLATAPSGEQAIITIGRAP